MLGMIDAFAEGGKLPSGVRFAASEADDDSLKPVSRIDAPPSTQHCARNSQVEMTGRWMNRSSRWVAAAPGHSCESRLSSCEKTG
jgi:hypothetical protein